MMVNGNGSLWLPDGVQAQTIQETEDLERRYQQAYQRLLKESVDLFDEFVDPLDAYRENGELWEPIGGGGPMLERAGFRTQQELDGARRTCRLLAERNEFAINGHENRISYVVGTGHKYTAVGKRKKQVPPELVAQVQSELDEFCWRNKWRQRQEEIVRRRDRDGECFLRFFAGDYLQVRFVEPGQVRDPQGQVVAGCSFGVQTAEGDVLSTEGYWVDNDFIEAEQIQHRKANVDSNVRRGMPTFWPVKDNLRRADHLLRNMAAVSDIQTRIAMIRKHKGQTKGSIQAFRNAAARYTQTDPSTGETRYFQHYAPASILDTDENTTHEFPSMGIDSAKFVFLLQAILRAIASRLVMPEFMLTSDASNANYSSTMVSEGPAVKMFKRLQQDQIDDDLYVMWRVVRLGIDKGRIDPRAEELVEIQATGPDVESRDLFQETNRRQVLAQNKQLSPQTWASQEGLEYEQEQQNIADHVKAYPNSQPAMPSTLISVNGAQPPTSQPSTLDPAVQASNQDVQVATDLVLNGAQITAATGIVAQVAAGEIPRDAGVGQLQILFNLKPEQAEAIMGSAGTSAPTTPNPRPAEATQEERLRKAADVLWEGYP